MQSDTKEEYSLCLFDPESRSVLFALDGHGNEIVRGGQSLPCYEVIFGLHSPCACCDCLLGKGPCFEDSSELMHQIRLADRCLMLRYCRCSNECESQKMLPSGLSHSLRTPLAAIIGLSDLGLESDANKKSRTYFSRINESGRNMLSLVDNLMEMNRISKGETKLTEQYFDRFAMLDSLKRQMQGVAERKRIELKVDFSGLRFQWVLADQMKIRAVYENLLSNAIRFSDPGSVVTWKIEDSPHEFGRFVLNCTITDHGCGMSRKFLAKAGIPFEQEHSRFTDSVPGNGLGLTIVKHTLSLMDSSLDIDSAEGKGTCVHFSIERKYQYLPNSGETNLSGSKILLAEDNKINTLVLKHILEQNGMDVCTAVDGKMALDLYLASNGSFDAILMDLRMPVMDGIESARCIRDSGCSDAGTIPIIAISAEAFDDQSDSLEHAGLDAFISKPIDSARLLDVLRLAIGQS